MFSKVRLDCSGPASVQMNLLWRTLCYAQYECLNLIPLLPVAVFVRLILEIRHCQLLLDVMRFSVVFFLC